MTVSRALSRGSQTSLFDAQGMAEPLTRKARLSKRLRAQKQRDREIRVEDKQLRHLRLWPQIKEPWPDHALLALLEDILFERLAILRDRRASSQTYRAVIDWIARPLCEPALQAREPLGFGACCLAAQVDAQILQQILLRQFAPERLAP